MRRVQARALERSRHWLALSGLVGLLLAGLALAGSLACENKDAAAKQGSLAAENFDAHECAACGMIVREQPAPRGQLIHRDGTRPYFCSVGDMLTYLRAPSAHGETVAVYVESMDPKHLPGQTATDRRPWLKAEQASYVLGVKRPRVMGAPVLAYAKAADATQVAAKHGGHVLDWPALRATELGSNRPNSEPPHSEPPHSEQAPGRHEHDGHGDGE